MGQSKMFWAKTALWWVIVVFFIVGGFVASEPPDHVEPTKVGARQLAECQNDLCIKVGLQPDVRNNISDVSWSTTTYCKGEEGEEVVFRKGTEIYKECNVELRTTTVGKIISIFKGD